MLMNSVISQTTIIHSHVVYCDYAVYSSWTLDLSHVERENLICTHNESSAKRNGSSLKLLYLFEELVLAQKSR